MNAVIERAHLVPAEGERLVDTLLIPPRPNTSRKKCLHLRSNIERVVVPRVEQRLDAEAIASGKQRLLLLIPDHEGKPAAKLMQALRPQLFVKVQSNLAVRAGAQTMPARLQFPLAGFVRI